MRQENVKDVGLGLDGRRDTYTMAPMSNTPSINEPKPQATATHCVWYASTGCLPDADSPEFYGTIEECEEYIREQRAERDADPEYNGTHDLYDWFIDWNMEQQS